jgi:hypothetical protein
MFKHVVYIVIIILLLTITILQRHIAKNSRVTAAQKPLVVARILGAKQLTGAISLAIGIDAESGGEEAAMYELQSFLRHHPHDALCIQGPDGQSLTPQIMIRVAEPGMEILYPLPVFTELQGGIAGTKIGFFDVVIPFIGSVPPGSHIRLSRWLQERLDNQMHVIKYRIITSFSKTRIEHQK